MLGILKYGSRSEEAKIIPFGIFARGVKVLSDIYLQALQILANRRKTYPKSLSRSKIDIISNVLANERRNYFNRLKHIYRLGENISDFEVVIKAEAAAKDYLMRIIFDQETLSYHYQLTRLLIRILHLKPEDFVLPVERDILSDSIESDLFFTDVFYRGPGFGSKEVARISILDPLDKYGPILRILIGYNEKLADTKSSRRESPPERHEDIGVFVAGNGVKNETDNSLRFRLDTFKITNDTAEDKLLINYVENMAGINNLGDPTANLICAHLIWFNAPCKTNPNIFEMGEGLLQKLTFTPAYEHSWFKKWKASGFMVWDQPSISTMNAYLDQLFIQSLFLKIVSLMQHLKQNKLLSHKKKIFLDDLMKRNVDTMSAFLKVKESLENMDVPRPHTGTQHSFALFEMLKTSNILTHSYGVSPLQLSQNLQEDNIIISELFQNYYRRLINNNQKAHQILCEFKVIKSRYWCKGISYSEIYDDFQAVATRPWHQQLTYLFDKTLESASDRVLKIGGSSDYKVLVTASKLISDLPFSTCTHMSQILNHTLAIPCPQSGMMLLTAVGLNGTHVEDLEIFAKDTRFSMSKRLVDLLKFTPTDLNITGRRRYNKLVRMIFASYFAKENADTRRNLQDLTKLYKEAKRILTSRIDRRELSRSQVFSSSLLIRQVKAASVNALQRIFNVSINTKHLDHHGMKRIIQGIQSTRDITHEEMDQLMEYVGNQKMYVVKKLVIILDLSMADFNTIPFLNHVTSKQYKHMFPHEVLNLERNLKNPKHHMKVRSNSKSIIEKKDDFDIDLLSLPDYVNLNITIQNMTRRNIPSRQDVGKRNLIGVRNSTKVSARIQQIKDISLRLYQRALSIVSERSENDNITSEQIKKFEGILSFQNRNIKEELKNIVSSEDAIDVNGNDKHSLVILTKPLTPHQRQTLNNKIVKQQLRITKQIIMLLQLTQDDFVIGDPSKISKKIIGYLFGSLAGRTNDYLHSVNVLYQVCFSLHYLSNKLKLKWIVHIMT